MQNSKLKLGLALATTALMLSACGGSSSPKTPAPQPATPTLPAEQTGTIYGKVSPAGTATIKPLAQIVVGPEFVAKVNSQGEFNLPLPSAAVVESKYSGALVPLKDYFGVCDSVTTLPNDFKILPLTAMINDTGTQLEVSSNGGTTFTYWWFSNKTGTVDVTADNCLFLGKVKQSFAFKRGWNMVKLTANGTSASYQVSAPSTKRFIWTPQGITGQSLNKNFHTPWLNLDQYKNR